MMKQSLKSTLFCPLAFTLMSLAFSNSALAVPAYRLWCKGPLSVTNVTGDRMTLAFDHSTVAAGPFGRPVKPGTCSWEDRPVGPTEPFYLNLVVRTAGTPAEQLNNRLRFNSLAAQLSSAVLIPNSRIFFNAVYSDQGVFHLDVDVMATYGK
jgi:hypothetical protein